MSRLTDVRVTAAALYFLPVETRVPLKFGREIATYVTCARACLRVRDARGRTAVGWGETPLSVQWVWPSTMPYEDRHEALKHLCVQLAESWSDYDRRGHPIEIGHAFVREVLPECLEMLNTGTPPGSEPVPGLAGLVCCSAFDIALHDAYGALHAAPVYQTYGPDYMTADLSQLITPADDVDIDFAHRFPESFTIQQPPTSVVAWHLVGGLDPLDEDDLQGNEPDDGYPVTLREWIARDGLKCLKVKLLGTDSEWDTRRLVDVGKLAIEGNVDWLTSDFNCTVSDPRYVVEILDRLLLDHPRIYGMLLYVEQPFPYDLEAHRIDVHSISARKPLFMDESAHDWRMVRLGRELGWTGVALKTCKTQTGALLSMCWAKAHGMTLMVQDLTNPMLAQIPHVLLAAHAGTIMGVETNAMQFYPEASRPESLVHPGLYRRQNGAVDLSTLSGPGFGYRLGEIERDLPEPVAAFGDW
ncbi:MAG: mandelate racemase/muconate lactonizing enzyme family protein [Chloroflexi bacterium]|nr:mandelate racemase/muconate lactonizing enzyme family protein [Chloroflexota bacterium]